jgi:hypothetical protein
LDDNKNKLSNIVQQGNNYVPTTTNKQEITTIKNSKLLETTEDSQQKIIEKFDELLKEVRLIKENLNTLKLDENIAVNKDSVGK